MKEIIYRIDSQKNFSNAQKQIFLDLLIKQEKIRNPTMKKINGCTLLCICMVDGKTISIGAIKPKTNSDFNPDKADLDKLRNDFSLELGYCFTLPNHGGKGYSSTIV